MNAVHTKSLSENKLKENIDKSGNKKRRKPTQFLDGKNQLTEHERKGFGHVWSRMIGKVGA